MKLSKIVTGVIAAILMISSIGTIPARAEEKENYVEWVDDNGYTGVFTGKFTIEGSYFITLDVSKSNGESVFSRVFYGDVEEKSVKEFTYYDARHRMTEATKYYVSISGRTNSGTENYKSINESDVLDLRNVTERVSLPEEINISETGVVSWKKDEYVEYGGYVYAMREGATAAVGHVAFSQSSDYYLIDSDDCMLDLRKIVNNFFSDDSYKDCYYKIEFTAYSEDLLQKLNSNIGTFKASFTREDIMGNEEETEETPGETPEETPGETPEETPEETPGETPEETPEEAPGETPEETPEEVPGETPEETPEEAPGETPEETPEEVPGETPEETPEEIPAVPDVKPENGSSANTEESVKWEPTSEEDIYRFSCKKADVNVLPDYHHMIMLGEVQGPLFFEAIQKVIGNKEIAATYNLCVDGVISYSTPKNLVTFTIPEELYVEGKSYSLVGVEADGKPVILKDMDSDKTTISFIPADAYAYALFIN